MYRVADLQSCPHQDLILIYRKIKGNVLAYTVALVILIPHQHLRLVSLDSAQCNVGHKPSWSPSYCRMHVHKCSYCGCSESWQPSFFRNIDNVASLSSPIFRFPHRPMRTEEGTSRCFCSSILVV